jgi:predicted nucleotidyltransferase
LRKPKDRDFIKTREDLIFCVVGYSHPPDRLLAYLKYIPSNEGIWASGDLHFKRMIPYYSSKSVGETFSFLKAEYPQYLSYLSVNKITFPTVPYSDVKEYFEPEKRLTDLAKRKGELDALELKAVELAEYVSQKTSVPFDKFGITGSILLGIHNVSISDIDLTIYGYKNSLTVKQALIEEYKKKRSPLRLLTKTEVKEWCTKKTEQFPIDFDSAALIFRRKWNFGYYRERFFSIHPTRLDSEITEEYGEQEYESEGPIEIKAQVEDDTQSLFNPSLYRVGKVQTLEGPKNINDINEVVTFESVFFDIASPKKLIRARGNLESVTKTRTGERYHRVVVGSENVSSPEYIVPVDRQ